MKFAKVAATLLATGVVAAQQLVYCGDYRGCDKNKIAPANLSGDLKLVATRDQDDPNIHYEIGGKVTITSDCEFVVENFYMSPQPKDPVIWSGSSAVITGGIKLNNDPVLEVKPDAPTKLTYNVLSTNLDCKAALINEVSHFTLSSVSADGSRYQLLAYADIAGSPVGPPPGVSGAPSNPSTGGNTNTSPSTGGNTSGSNTTQTKPATTTTAPNPDDKSGATTSKWTMGLLALSSAVAYLLA